MSRGIGLLIGSAVLGALAIIFGLVSDTNILFALGLADTFLSLLLIPVFVTRDKKRARISLREDALLVFQYSADEAARIAAVEAKKTRTSSIKLSILACICLAVIFAPFPVILENQIARELVFTIGIVVAVVPFLSLVLAAFSVVRQITKEPSVTVVGRDYILLTNRYLGINDRTSLTLVDAEVKAGGNAYRKKNTRKKDGAQGRKALYLTYTFTMKYGSIMHFTVEVPIPEACAEEARRFAESIKQAAEN
jgi:hypothetical protein